MRSATFRNIALGTLALAASYQLGARIGTAQAGPLFRVLGSSPLTVETGGQVYYLGQDGGWTISSELPPVPVGSLLAGDPGGYVTADGTAWRKNGYTGVWDSYPLPGSPTPAQEETWGALKSRYRGARGAAPAPQDR